MPHAWLITDSSEQVMQPGFPPARQAAYTIEIPDGKTGLEAVVDFVATVDFPIGTRARVIDTTQSPITIQEFELQSQWVPVPTS